MGDAHVTTQEDRKAGTPSHVTGGPVSAGSTRTRTRARLGALRSPRRPRLWFEILLIAVSYWLYSLVRNAVPEQKAAALRNADWIWSLEHAAGLAFEKTVNHAVNSVTWLIVSMNYYYATLHFIVTIAVLVWLFRRHPGRYAAARLILFATTAVALLGYYLFPLAPPRLMRGGGFIDTVLLHETWGSMASGNFKQMSNQYAAMPSMHIGWSLWCGLTVFALARVPWVRVLGLLYPVATLVVIVATANHFWLDAVGGMACLAFGYAVSYVWYGSLPHRLPKVVPGRRRTGRLRALRRPVSPAASRPAPGPAASRRAPVPSGPPAPGRPSAPSASRPVVPPRRPEPDTAAAVPPTPPGA
ncbi:phosphatase PAP2 family protein [Streptomyces sp. NBC_01754]|uniref:phosphatase PAP2 family protein n=1 Tax=Streptomyces sp. NBC_01754 TaxID=2975930 RepID=UPI002DD7E4D6|nr:phosphatase PAP2 family protein [Streptomyces sp. NBC_01754]WSC92147.1 phosphatase PAP2 family protein [Streptomyces sp. NBC_01754]